MSGIDNNKRELIAREAIKVLKKRFDLFPEDASENRNAPFHEAFLQAFSDKLEESVNDVPYFISLSSWLQGLNTTLGQTFFENTAHILSDGAKTKFALKIQRSQQESIASIITDLKNGMRLPDVENENRLVFVSDGPEVDAPEFTVDNLVDDGASIDAFELKTVKPNASGNRDEKQKMLVGKAALWKKYPDRKISYFIGFPFDPLNNMPTGADKDRFMDSIVEFQKFFHPDEVLLADEFWNKLSGAENTMRQILDIINAIATPEFIDNIEFLSDSQNAFVDNKRYGSLLQAWSLYSELRLMDRLDQIRLRCQADKKVAKVFYQPVFDTDGKYNEGRCQLLLTV